MPEQGEKGFLNIAIFKLRKVYKKMLWERENMNRTEFFLLPLARQGYFFARWLLKNKYASRGIAVLQYLFIAAIFWYLFQQGKSLDFSLLKWRYVLLSLLTVLVLRMTSVYRIAYLIRRSLPLPIPLRKIWKLQSTAILLGLFTPGKLGEGSIVFLGSKRREKVHLASMFAFCKLLDGVVYVPFALFFAFMQRTYLPWVLLLLGIFVGMLFLYTKMNQALHIDASKIMLPRVYVLTGISLFLQAAGLYFIILSKGVHLSFMNTILIWSIASIVALLSTFPGGIGVREAGISFLLKNSAGVDFSLAITISLLHGFILYATTLLFTLLSHGWIRGISSTRRKWV